MKKCANMVSKDEKVCSKYAKVWESMKKYERVRESLSKCKKHVKACEKISGK